MKLLNLLLKMLIVLGKNSSLVKAVESVVEAVDCCRLFCVQESSRFVEIAESVVEDVDRCRLHYVL